MQHANRWHSLDILFVELVKIIFWFHPVIYLLKHELIQQHEFEIDRLLTTHKIDIEQYGNLLIQQAQQIPVQLSFANNFNHSIIKNRIQMMTKQKSNNIQLLRYAMLIPLLSIAAALMAFEKQHLQPALLDVLKVDVINEESTEIKTDQITEEKITVAHKREEQVIRKTVQAQQTVLHKPDSNKTNLKSNSPTFTIVEEMPKFPGGDLALLEHFRSNMNYPTEAQSNDIQGVVVIGFTVERNGSISELSIIRDIGGGCGEEALRLARLMPIWSPGKQYGKAERVAFKLPVRFKLDDNQTKKDSTKILYPIVINNQKTDAVKQLKESNAKELSWEKANSRIHTIVEDMPEFPGGDIALLQFFGSNIIYPDIAKENDIQGVVVLAFIVEKDGSISNLKIAREIGGGCGEEALRIAKKMPTWTPGMEEGKPVRVEFKLPVRFALSGDENEEEENSTE